MSPHSQTPLVDEKRRHEGLHLHAESERVPLMRRRTIQHFLPAVLLFSALLLLFRSTFSFYGKLLKEDIAGLENVVQMKKVALEAHIMSKCPDARDCLQQLVVPTMERVSDKVDFKLSYIGRYNQTTTSYVCVLNMAESMRKPMQ